MNTNMRERLDELECKLGGGNKCICVRQYLDETKDDAKAKIERWRSGKDEPDVVAYQVTGGEEIVIYALQFGRNSDGSMVSAFTGKMTL